MIYVQGVTTSANVLSSQAVKTVVPVTYGFVYRIEVDFPFGCAGLLHVTINDGDRQVWPSSPSETFHSDGTTIAFDDCYLKTEPPFQFILSTYNLDDTYEHFTQVRIGMVSHSVFIARFLPTFAYTEIANFMAKFRAEQDFLDSLFLANPFGNLKGTRTNARQA